MEDDDLLAVSAGAVTLVERSPASAWSSTLCFRCSTRSGSRAFVPAAQPYACRLAHGWRTS
jgi:hypothetical protein